MKTAFGFFNHHLVTTTHKDRDSLAVLASLNHNHVVLGGTKGELTNTLGKTQLFGTNIFKFGNDSTTSSNGNQLHFDTTHPTDGRKLILQQKMVGLIIKAPLTDDEVGTALLDLLYHVHKVLLFTAGQLLVVLHGGHLELALGLHLGRLERTGENTHASVLDVLGHLRVTHVLVDEDTLDEVGVAQLAAHLALHLDEVEVHVASVQIGHGQHGTYGHLAQMSQVRAHDLGAERSHRHTHQRLHALLVHVGSSRRSRRCRAGRVVTGSGGKLTRTDGSLGDPVQDTHVDLLADGGQMAYSKIARLLVAVRDADRMDATLEQTLGLLEESAGQDHHAGGAIADLCVLALAQLHQQLGHLVLHLHVVQDGGAIVADGHLAVGTHQHLVHAARAQ
mmetsp:Transcript_6616/g.16680  ORF Transcript_6616/g.16680 Transcript_6616/m.16680 type:complete len:391 (+) Transcript_6616:475-1647(+)